MSDGSTVYASPEHLYVTTTRWFNWHTQPEGPDDGTLAETEIHVFDTGDVLSSHYVGSATVTGTVLNQYSMSEHEGHLRIATTTVPPWRFEGEPDSESLVTVFAVDADGLWEVRPSQRARPRRAHLRREVLGRHRRRGHVPPDRSVVHN